MKVRRLEAGEQLGLRRGCPVVCIPVYGALEVFKDCLASVLRHTPPEVPILVADDATPGEDVEAFMRGQPVAEDREVLFFRQPANVGFVGNMNTAFALTAPADVVILNSDCVVAAGWLPSLKEAAYSDDTIATVSALTNNGTILSVPYRNRPVGSLVPGWTLDEAARVIQQQSLRLRPRIPTAVGHCVYVRRQALDLVGDFDTRLSPGYGEEVDFSQRCLLRGLCHVAADDVFVLHHGAASFRPTTRTARLQEAHEQIIAARYPYYEDAVEEAASSATTPLAQALLVARVALLGLSITIDASCLGPDMTGTQVHTLELIRHFSRISSLRLRVAVPANLGSEARRQLAKLGALETIVWEDVSAATGRTDLVHRAYQVSGEDELTRLRHLGERVIVTQQDLIAYRNPGYFADAGAWRRYRGLTRHTLLTADLVVFFSQHAANEAQTEKIIDPQRIRVVHIGTNHQHTDENARLDGSALANQLAGREFMLCLGTDFRHKNRLFALRLLQELQRRHDWGGCLVLAGPRVSQGSSLPEEHAFLRDHPRVAAATVSLPGVTESTRGWLMANTKLVLYPTVEEGFGLMPFEAAEVGVPCLYAAHTSLAEILPRETALIVPWDAESTADRAIEVMRDPARSREIVEAIRRAAATLTWEATGERLLEVYQEVMRSPARLVEQLEEARHPNTGVTRSMRLAFHKSLFLWRTYGIVDGSRRVGRGVARRVKRRLALPGALGPSSGSSPH